MLYKLKKKFITFSISNTNTVCAFQFSLGYVIIYSMRANFIGETNNNQQHLN